MYNGVDKYLKDGCMRCKYGATPQCKVHQWARELSLLRKLVLEEGLTEEIKWGMPCYTMDNKNIVIISAFKDYCGLLFHKGALLKDSSGLLLQQTENVQAARQMRFTAPEQVRSQETIIRDLIRQAIAVEKAGLKVPLKKTEAFEMVSEFREKLEELPHLKSAFENLTPGRQRGYLLHFAAPKQSATKVARIEKCIPMILAGKGLDR